MTTSADYDDDLDERVEDETLIDDLFTFEDDDEPARRGGRSGTGLRWWIKAVFAGAGLVAVAIFGLRVAGYTVPIVAVVGVIVALIVLRRVTSALVPPQVTRQRRRSAGATEDGSYNFSDRDALRTVVGRWERLLQRAGGDAGSARAVQRTLAEIVDERLRQRHGLTRAGDPERARALLGEPLWTYLATPPTRNLAPRDATAYVQSLERL
ncbi:hypothetical protein Ais01nite_40240 [Asanoa ishikariensis]|uniref:Uncharacterized protein n=1 Tax=Asanoa ishikariensis TaxID=137265 RepID=A0A1H3M907_9ACTN|nr:hypothetical protein [Asanoa ishikariensis]GIF65989.1 hypothetical protein Ais01nite_40240 [Asanoa ishikariensis]SDY73161.1 hypothetical protein SAMN05421684_1260 [Asanoa ishikariensis]